MLIYLPELNWDISRPISDFGYSHESTQVHWNVLTRLNCKLESQYPLIASPDQLKYSRNEYIYQLFLHPTQAILDDEGTMQLL